MHGLTLLHILVVVLTYLPTYWQKTHLKTPLIYLQHCHVDEYSGSIFGALDFRYNWSCLVRVSCVCASTQLCRAEHLATNPKNV